MKEVWNVGMYTKTEKEFIKEIKEKKKYIPPMSHPWKLASFKKQIEKAHTSRVYA